MAITVSGTTITFNDSTTMTSGYQACKLWVNYAASSSPSVRGSYNVTSVTWLDTGTIRTNFSITFADTVYALVLGGQRSTDRTNTGPTSYIVQATTYCTVVTTGFPTPVDFTTVSLAIFR